MRSALSVLTIAVVLSATAWAAEPRPTGIFSDLTYNSEGGDLLGAELLIVPGPVAFVQLSEGDAPFTALVPVTISGAKIEFHVPGYTGAPNLRFVGTLDAQGISGSWFDGSKPLAPFGGGKVDVNADVILDHAVEVKVDHLSEDGGFFRTAHADSGASRGDPSIEASGDGHPSDCEGARAVAQDRAAIFT